MKNDRIMVISDTHFPAHHRDTFDFLDAVKKDVKPTRAIHIGDEVDFAAISYHEKDASLPSAGDEFRCARPHMATLETMFQELMLLLSNHNRLPYRKAQTIGLPLNFLKLPQELWETKKWSWHEKIELKTPDGALWQLHHGDGKAGALAKVGSYGISTMHGHEHIKHYSVSIMTPYGRRWAAHTGCLVDNDHLAMAYGKTNLQLPALGTSAIIDGVPVIYPMKVNSKNRWIGRL